jgi:hypothetical protein
VKMSKCITTFMTISSGRTYHITTKTMIMFILSISAASTIAISTAEGKWEKKAEKVTKTHIVTHQYSVTVHHSS